LFCFEVVHEHSNALQGNYPLIMFPESLVVVLGIVLIVEGIPWFLSPRGTKRMLIELSKMNDLPLRGIGLAFMLVGLLLVAFVKNN
jgi:uncharacterized protein YjeT (DUF2065 family)